MEVVLNFVLWGTYFLQLFLRAVYTPNSNYRGLPHNGSFRFGRYWVWTYRRRQTDGRWSSVMDWHVYVILNECFRVHGFLRFMTLFGCGHSTWRLCFETVSIPTSACHYLTQSRVLGSISSIRSGRVVLCCYILLPDVVMLVLTIRFPTSVWCAS